MTDESATPTPRKFQSLNHPEPEGDGRQLYSVHEIGWVTDDGNGDQHKTYTRVADNLTLAEAEAYIEANGVWDE